MISDSLRQRIAALNRGRLRAPPGGDAALPSAPQTVVDGRNALPPSRGSFHATIEEALPLLQEARLPGGVCGRIEQRLSDLFPGGCSEFEARYIGSLQALRDPCVESALTDRLRPLAHVDPPSILYVDIEATGLTSGTPLFLVGTLEWCDAPGEDRPPGFRLQQLLARHYGEEGVVLSLFADQLERASAVVSFNGKRYDLPYLRDRSAYHAVAFPFDQPHIDLLHESRARFRHRLPNCRLQTLERALCRRVRSGDIPGAEIPDAYHRFVRTGNGLEMREIVHHNAMDLITLAEVMVHVLQTPPPVPTEDTPEPEPRT